MLRPGATPDLTEDDPNMSGTTTTATGATGGTGDGGAGAGGSGAGSGTGGAGGSGAGSGTGGAGGTGAGGGGDGLGEGGIAALRAERDARSTAERERDEAKARLEALENEHATDSDKALKKARDEGAAEATLAANRRIVRSEVKAAAGGKLADPGDAAGLLGDLDRFIVKGDVDDKAISSAIDDLVKAKPYLAATGTGGKARPLSGGGATQNSGSSFNDRLREEMRGRR
jgi:hypothetical protein